MSILEHKKSVIIIGAGISGLTAGCYLQKNGFTTEIFERHSIPGGLCTSWQNGKYTFDGCAHWILGTGPGSSFYKMWNEILDMEKIKFINHDYRIAIEVKDNVNKYGDKLFYLYNNLNKLRNYITDLSPEDIHVINDFIKDIRFLQQFELPPVLEDNGWLKNSTARIKMIRYLGLFIKYLQLKNKTNFTLAARFKSPFLAEVFRKLYDDDEVNLMVMMVPMAAYDLESAGYPESGSLSFAEKIADKYLEAGGIIHYKTPVLAIETHMDTATGVTVRNNVYHPADYIISTIDWHFTMFDLLKAKYDTSGINKIINDPNNRLYFSTIQCSFGVKKNLSHLDHFTRFPLEYPLPSPDGSVYDRMEIHNYSYDNTLAPPGHTSVCVNFYTREFDFWIDLRKSNKANYKFTKAQFLSKVQAILIKKLPELEGYIEVAEMTTPATYLRYTNNWKGSTQGWLPGKNLLADGPVKTRIPGLRNVFLSSHWNQPGGGIPVAINMGRNVTQLLCRLERKRFITRRDS